MYRINGQEPITLDLTNPNWKQTIPAGTPGEGIYVVRAQDQLLKVGDLSGINRLGEYRGWVTGDAIPIAVDYYPLQQPLPGPLRRVTQDLRGRATGRGLEPAQRLGEHRTQCPTVYRRVLVRRFYREPDRSFA